MPTAWSRGNLFAEGGGVPAYDETIMDIVRMLLEHVAVQGEMLRNTEVESALKMCSPS